MEWPREWTRVPEIELRETIYEKKYFRQGGVAKIVFANTNPKGLNLITSNGIREIMLCLRHARLDTTIGVVIITGAGDKSFNIGGDIREEIKDPRSVFEEMAPIHDHLRWVGKPVIAVVKGYCIGMGNHLAYHCDFTIAADNAIFGQVGPRIASPACGRYVTHLARVVGHKKAREIWMLCRQYTADEALKMGLVNVVVPLDKIDEEVDKWCQELLEKNPTCLRLVKASFDADIEDIPHPDAWFQNIMAPKFIGSEEQQEAMKAFLEKRQPDWGKVIRGRPESFG